MNNKNDSNQYSILIADDDPAICDSLQFMLEEEGYAVTTTVNGSTIYNIERKLPDLILLDIWMSGQDGRKICEFLKNNERTKNIPIIMISASIDIKNSATSAGADDFISKPFEMNNLLGKISSHLENSTH